MYRTPELCASFTLIYGDPDIKQEQEFLNALYGLTPRPTPRVHALTSRITRSEHKESDLHYLKELESSLEQHNNDESLSDKANNEEATWVSLLASQRPQPVHGGAFITSHEAYQNNSYTANKNNKKNIEKTANSCTPCESDTCDAHLDENYISNSYYFTESGAPSLAVFVPCDEEVTSKADEDVTETITRKECMEAQEEKSKDEVCPHHNETNNEEERLAKLISLQRPWAVPSARSGHVLLSCSDYNCLVLHGGFGDAVMNDTWTFDCETRRWHELPCRPVSGNATTSHTHMPECAYGQAGCIYHRSSHTHLLVVGGITMRVMDGEMKDTCVRNAYSLDLQLRLWERLPLTLNLPALWGATGQTLHAPRRVHCSKEQLFDTEEQLWEKQEEEEVFVMFGGVTRFDETLNDVYLFHLDHVLTHNEVYHNADLYLESAQYSNEVNQRVRKEMKRERNNFNNSDNNETTTNTPSRVNETESTEVYNEFYQEWLLSEEEEEDEEYSEEEEEYSWEAYNNSDNDNNSDEHKRMRRRPLPWEPSSHEIEEWISTHASTIERWRSERINSFVGKYWVEKLPLPDGLRGRRRACSAAFDEHFMFIFGGRVTFDFFNDLWVFNLCTRTWVELNVRTPLVWLRRFYSEPHNVIPGQMLNAFRLENDGKEIKPEILNKWESAYNVVNGNTISSESSATSSNSNNSNTNTVNESSNTSNSVNDNESTLLLSAPLSLTEPLASSFYTITNFTTAMPRTGSCMVADPTRQCLYIYGGFTVFHARYVSFSDLHAYYITENSWKVVQINTQRLWKPHLDAGKGMVMKPNAFADAYETGSKRAWRPQVKQLNRFTKSKSNTSTWLSSTLHINFANYEHHHSTLQPQLLHNKVNQDAHLLSESALLAQLESNGDTVKFGDPTDNGGRSFAQYVEKYISVNSEQHSKHGAHDEVENDDYNYNQTNKYTQTKFSEVLPQCTEPIAPRFQRCSLMRSASTHREHHDNSSGSGSVYDYQENSNTVSNNKRIYRRINGSSKVQIEFFQLPVIKPTDRTMAAMATHPSNPGSRFYLFSGRAEDDVIADMFEVEVEAYTEANRQYTNLLDTITKVQTLTAELKDSYHSQRLKQSLRAIHYEQVAVYKECYRAWLASHENAHYERNDVPFCTSLRGSVSAWLRDIMQVEQITNLFTKMVVKQSCESLLLPEIEERIPNTLSSTTPLQIGVATEPHFTEYTSSHVNEAATEQMMPRECEREVHNSNTTDEHGSDDQIEEEEEEEEEEELEVINEVDANDVNDAEDYADNGQLETWKYRYYWEEQAADKSGEITPTQHLLSGADKLKVILHGFANGKFATDKDQPNYLERDCIGENYSNNANPIFDKKNSTIVKLITGEETDDNTVLQMKTN